MELGDTGQWPAEAWSFAGVPAYTFNVHARGPSSSHAGESLCNEDRYVMPHPDLRLLETPHSESRFLAPRPFTEVSIAAVCAHPWGSALAQFCTALCSGTKESSTGTQTVVSCWINFLAQRPTSQRVGWAGSPRRCIFDTSQRVAASAGAAMAARASLDGLATITRLPALSMRTPRPAFSTDEHHWLADLT